MMNRPRHLSAAQIAEHARRHRTDELPFDLTTPIDFGKPFVCPSLTSLFYAPVWRELSSDDQLRYTQLSALSFNELIAWFEEGFTATLTSLLRSDRLSPELHELLPDFIEDEYRHQRMWWALNRAVDPQRYPRNGPAITRISSVASGLMKWLAQRPLKYPVCIWLMLILEEHANEIARRCAMQRPDGIEPHFASAYLAHVRDETRHVQIDWLLLESLWPCRSKLRRRVNIWLFGFVINRLLFRTENAAISVAEELVRERPRLRHLLPRMRAELREVGRRPEFRSMMFSAESSPIAFHMLEQLPELRGAIA